MHVNPTLFTFLMPNFAIQIFFNHPLNSLETFTCKNHNCHCYCLNVSVSVFVYDYVTNKIVKPKFLS